jgi:hypothetical protein
MAKNLLTFYNPRPFKICPNWDVWYAKIPSGNPVNLGTYVHTEQIQKYNFSKLLNRRRKKNMSSYISHVFFLLPKSASG